MNINNFSKNVPLKDKSWFHTGGNAQYYYEPTTNEEFRDALQVACANNIPVFVLGSGANILISDNGFNGLVIHSKITTRIFGGGTNLDYVYVTGGSGLEFQDLIDYSISNYASGLEEFSGIPGSVGGSVYINIHYYEFLLSQFLLNAEVVDCAGKNIITVDNNWFNFGYDQSKLLDKQYYLLSATFKLKPVSGYQREYIRGRRDEIIRHRLRRYPKSYTCGSFFKNFTEAELTNSTLKDKITYVAYYFDKLGIKGELSCGDAKVSSQHANMIINTGNATSSDIIALACKMQKLVYENFGIIPQPECQLLGFDQYPLMK